MIITYLRPDPDPNPHKDHCPSPAHLFEIALNTGTKVTVRIEELNIATAHHNLDSSLLRIFHMMSKEDTDPILQFELSDEIFADPQDFYDNLFHANPAYVPSKASSPATRLTLFQNRLSATFWNNVALGLAHLRTDVKWVKPATGATVIATPCYAIVVAGDPNTPITPPLTPPLLLDCQITAVDHF